MSLVLTDTAKYDTLQSMTYLLKTGRWSGRIRKHLRAFLAAQPNQNAYINNLIDKDQQKATKKAK